MTSIRWALYAVTAIACAGDSALAPGPTADVGSTARSEILGSRREATKHALVEGEAGLELYLRTVTREKASLLSAEDGRRHQEDVAEVQAALDRVRWQIRELSRPNFTVSTLRDGTPVYPENAYLDWVDGGTWIRLAPDGSVFTASSQFSSPAFLHTMIRGNTSTGWSRSSDDGLSVTPLIPMISDAARPLEVPPGNRDCNASAVTVWGNSEHTAQYARSINVGPTEVNFVYQTASRGNRSQDVRCEHTPLDGEIVASGDVVVGGTGTVAVFWRGSQSSTVTDCPTSWSTSNSGLSLQPGSGADSRTYSAVEEGSTQIVANCRGVTVSATVSVLPTAPPPTCGDPAATNYGEHADCIYPGGDGGGGSGGGGGGDAYAPPPVPSVSPGALEQPYYEYCINRYETTYYYNVQGVLIATSTIWTGGNCWYGY